MIKINATMGKLHFLLSLSIENFGLKKYFSDVCQFSHSDEECKVWNYMKENNSKSIIKCRFLTPSILETLIFVWRHHSSFETFYVSKRQSLWPITKLFFSKIVEAVI